MTSRAAAAVQTRERILQATFSLFRELEFDDVTFARIAETAMVSPQTVALHFRSKDGLVEALIEWWGPQERALRAMPSGDPVEAARRVCERYEVDGAATLRFLSVENRVPALRRIVDNGRDGHREWVEQTFGDRLGSGAARQRRLMALVAAYDVYTWSVMRRVLGTEDTVLAMSDLARGVLEQKGSKR
jgi:AcrR family transcriptional regulator